MATFPEKAVILCSFSLFPLVSCFMSECTEGRWSTLVLAVAVHRLFHTVPSAVPFEESSFWGPLQMLTILLRLMHWLAMLEACFLFVCLFFLSAYVFCDAFNIWFPLCRAVYYFPKSHVSVNFFVPKFWLISVCHQSIYYLLLNDSGVL